jgi:tellurite resistance protein TerC
MFSSLWLWVGCNLFVLALLALDLGVFHRKAHAVSTKEAAIWSVVWISLSLLFNGVIYLFWQQLMPGSSASNSEAGLQFLTGYLIEKALSVDNIFVFVLIFTFFRVPPAYQHRVLFWGILGALLMRGTMILAGAALIKQFHWIIYVFGAFLIFTGIRMAMQDEADIEPEANPVLRLVRRILPVTQDFRGQNFFVREPLHRGEKPRILATPLFIVLVLVETTDLIFAVDSIPAIFAVTQKPLLVYTSNVCAILGLRSLYFMLSGVIHRFYLLKIGIALVLVFVGAKMLLGGVFEIPIWVSLIVIALILGGSVGASILFPRAKNLA